jgi:GNAT superfamily N-acetyltransferase
MSFHIRELNRENWHDLVKLFEQDRLTSQCFCLSHRVTPQNLVIEKEAHDQMKEWVCPAPKLRAIRADEYTTAIDPVKVHGLLLYDLATPVGWISIDPLSALPGHDAHVDARPNEWSIHCVFLLPAYRKKALSQTLIRGALELAKSKGAEIVTAFPCPAGAEAGRPESLFFGGRMNTFLELGFTPNEKLSDLYHRVEYKFGV